MHRREHMHTSSITDWITYWIFNTGLCTEETNNKAPPKIIKRFPALFPGVKGRKSSYVSPEKSNRTWGGEGKEKLQGTEEGKGEYISGKTVVALEGGIAFSGSLATEQTLPITPGLLCRFDQLPASGHRKDSGRAVTARKTAKTDTERHAQPRRKTSARRPLAARPPPARSGALRGCGEALGPGQAPRERGGPLAAAVRPASRPTERPRCPLPGRRQADRDIPAPRNKVPQSR